MFKQRKVLLMIIPVVLVLALAFGFTIRAQAVEFDDDGTVDSEEVIDDDLFLAGDNVEVNGTVNGDLFAAGSTVIVNGTVKGSLFSGAQTIIVNGTVEGSFYGGSSTFTLGSDASIGRNLYYGGFNLTTEEGSLVNRDLLVGAYQALLSGEVGRDVRVGAAAFELDGIVGGDVRAEVDDPDGGTQPMPFYSPPGVETIVPAGIRISEEAEIGGKLIYKSPSRQEDAIEASPEGGTEFTQAEMPGDEVEEGARKGGAAALVGRWAIKRLREFITLLLLGALVLWQLPVLLTKVTQKVEEKTLPSTGWGLISLIVVYAGAFIVGGLLITIGIFFSVITLGGLSRTIFGVGFSSLALIMTVFALLVTYGSKLVVSMAAGNLIFRNLAPKYADQKVWPLLTGIILYVLLRAVPIFGGIFGFLVTLTGLGAMWLLYRGEKPFAAEESPA